jgi:hypothetical protein
MIGLFKRNGKFFAPYFWLNILLTPLALILFIKFGHALYMLIIYGSFPISDTFIISFLGFVATWFGIYNKWGKNGNNEKRQE